MLAILRSAWTYSVILILVGVLLTSVVHDALQWTWVLHLGVAFMVAGLLSAFLHLREISALFETLARKTLVQDEYLRRLSADQLRTMRSLTLRLEVGKAVDNPKHDWAHLAETIDKEIFSTYLPNTGDPRSGVYRSGYDEAISLKIMSLREALQDAGVPIADAAAQNAMLDQLQIRKHTSITTFDAISPKQNRTVEFDYPLEFNFSHLPDFPPKNRVRVHIGTDELSADLVDMGDPAVANERVTFAGSRSFPINGLRRFWVKTEEWYAVTEARFLLNTMSLLTKGVTASLSSDRVYRFRGGIFGLGKQDTPPKPMENGISLKYEGWLLEDNGYIIWWDE